MKYEKKKLKDERDRNELFTEKKKCEIILRNSKRQ